MRLDLSRRSFLGGVIAATAVTFAPRLITAVPRIVGDGIHDDAPGLNALFARQPVNILAAGVRVAPNGEIVVRNGAFRLDSTLLLRDRILIRDCRFEFCGPEGALVFRFADDASGSIVSNLISSTPNWRPLLVGGSAPVPVLTVNV